MHFIVTLLVCIRSYLRYSFKFRILIIRTLYVDVSSDVRIRGYFLKPKRSASRKVWGNSVLGLIGAGVASALQVRVSVMLLTVGNVKVRLSDVVKWS